MQKPDRKPKDSGSYSQYQQKRRDTALKQQQQARQQKVQQLRSLAQAAVQDGGVEPAPADAMLQDSAEAATAQQQQQHQQQPGAAAAAAAAPSAASPAGDDVMSDAAGAGAEADLSSQLYGLDGIDSSRLSGAALRSYFAQQLMVPEWLTDIPGDLPTHWLVMPRPEGRRCLVISSGGSTVSRTRTGSVLHRFASRLPAGGPCSNQGGFCVLDCIYQEPHLPVLPHEQPSQQQQQQQQQQSDVDMAGSNSIHANGSNRNNSSSDSSSSSTDGGTYYIQDVLVWRGYSLVDCGVDFRLFWLTSKLADEVSAGASSWALDGGTAGPGHQFRFKLLPHWPATPEGLTAAATAGSTTQPAAAAAPHACATAANGSSHPQQQQQQHQQQQQMQSFTQDGVYLRHAAGHYALGGCSSPLALLWKDSSCSRYLLETDVSGVVPQHQQVVLVYQGPKSAGVATADEPPIVLGRLPAEFVSAMSKVLRPGRLLRFSIREAGLTFRPTDGSPAGADLAYEGPANQRRGRADQFSKVLFQWQARRQPLQLADLTAAAAAAAATAAGTGVGEGAEAVAASDLSDVMLADAAVV